MNEDYTLISDEQLYALSQNKQLNKEFRMLAQKQLDNRRLTSEKWSKLKNDYELKNLHRKKELPNHWKIVLIIFPFFIFIHNIVASLMLDKGRERIWKQYWLYVSLGFLFYTILVFLLARRLVS